MSAESLLIFDFTPESSVKEWQVEDDVVMGGRSSGHFELSEEGYGVFWGNVSLENNGGFSNVGYQFEPVDISGRSKAVLLVKGDGKRYQLRLKPDNAQRHSYIHYFETTGEWQTIELPLKEFYPVFRGDELNKPNFNFDQLAQVNILIGNKKPQAFKLMIDKICVE